MDAVAFYLTIHTKQCQRSKKKIRIRFRLVWTKHYGVRTKPAMWILQKRKQILTRLLITFSNIDIEQISMQ